MIKRSISIRIVLISMLLAGSSLNVLPQARIQGELEIDTLWKPMLYLSEIPDFNQLYSVSFSNIIDSAALVNNSFSFSSETLPLKDHLYRIHVSKKGDPPASLIIGGKDQNHFFLIAKRGVDIQIRSAAGQQVFNNLQVFGYRPNDQLMQINSIVGLLDTLNFFGSPFSRDYIKEAVFTQLNHYADTCSNALVADYARYLSGNEPGSNRVRFLWFIVVAILLASAGLYYRKRSPKKKSQMTELSIQERKIFNLLKEGKSNKEIADEFAISVSTVKSHVNSIYSKLGVKSRKEVLDL